MGWRLRVVHTTRVSYTEPVRTSFNEARMTPLTLPKVLAKLHQDVTEPAPDS